MTFSPRSDAHAASQPRPGSGLARSRTDARVILTLFLLFCLLGQGTIVQSHIHFVRPAGTTAATSNRLAGVASSGKGDPAIDCRLCREAAIAGAYVLPSATVLPPPPRPFSWIASMAAAEFGLTARFHGWRSRAPPR